MDSYKRVLNKEYTPTVEEFNHLMHECIEYKKLLELADALRNPPEGVSAREALDVEYNIDREYPSVSSPMNSQRLEYIPGNINQNRLGIRNVEGNLPTEIIRDDEALMNYYENLRRMR